MVIARRSTLTASDTAAGDEFGASVAISGPVQVVGAPFHSHGAAYVFERSITWTQQAKLTASGPTPGGSDQFGRSVAISGETAVVGAPQHGTEVTGAAYVFDCPPPRAAQSERLLPL